MNHIVWQSYLFNPVYVEGQSSKLNLTLKPYDSKWNQKLWTTLCSKANCSVQCLLKDKILSSIQL